MYLVICAVLRVLEYYYIPKSKMISFSVFTTVALKWGTASFCFEFSLFYLIYSKEIEDYFLRARLEIISACENKGKSVRKIEEYRSRIYEIVLIALTKV